MGLPPLDFESSASTSFTTSAVLQLRAQIASIRKRHARASGMLQGLCYHADAMRRSDFAYHLPEDRIALFPPGQRRDSRLLLLDAETGTPRDGLFIELPGMLNSNDLLVFNNTRVIPARMTGQKPTGGRVEMLVERVSGSRRVLAHLRASKSPGNGSRLLFAGGIEAVVRGRAGDLFDLEFPDIDEVMDVLAVHGHVPLPPYIRRADGVLDEERYQTVYASRPGAVAAPTAGLHFDKPMLQQLDRAGIQQAHITLHVGAGTFQPVRVERLDEHVMHGEYYEIDSAVCDAITATHARGGRVVAVGTTVVRTLESAARSGKLLPQRGETELFITPGYEFRVVDALLTNFHLPESTLLMLVCAFAGYEPVMDAYRHAIAAGYRFYSYGDAMFIPSRAGGITG